MLRTEVKTELASGWTALLCSTIGYGCGSPLFMYTANLFVIPLETAKGWSRAEIAAGTSIVLLVTAIAMPLVGSLIDRVGARPVNFGSIVGYFIVCLLLGFGSYGLAGFYLLMILLALFFPGTSVIVFARQIIRSFKALRGTALAIMLSGTALVLTFVGPYLRGLMVSGDWQAGYRTLGTVCLVIGLPMGILATRSARGGEALNLPPDVVGLSLKAAIRTSVYWQIVLAVAAAALPLGGILGQLTPILVAEGQPSNAVAVIASVFVLAVVFGRIVVGGLLDLLNPGLVAAAVMAIAAVTLALLSASVSSFFICCLVAVAAGSAMGAEGDIPSFFTARFFGLGHFSAILGSISTFTSIGLAVGGYVYGRLFDTYGDYNFAIALSSGSFALSALMFATVCRRRPFLATAGATVLAGNHDAPHPQERSFRKNQ